MPRLENSRWKRKPDCSDSYRKGKFAPSVQYKVKLTDGTDITVDNPSYWPDPAKIDSVHEPYIKATILTPEEYVGAVFELCREHRSENAAMNYLAAGRLEVVAEMPLGEVLFDFYSKLKTVTADHPLTHHFDLQPGERLAVKRPAILRKVDGDWKLETKGIVSGVTG